MAFQPEAARLRPSPSLRWLSACCHLAAVLALFVTELPAVLATAFAGGLLWRGWHEDRRLARPGGGQGIQALRWSARDLEVYQPQYGWVRATLAEGSLVHPLGLLLRLELEEGSRCSLAVFPDALQGPAFRRLQVVLRHAGEAGRRQPSAPESPSGSRQPQS